MKKLYLLAALLTAAFNSFGDCPSGYQIFDNDADFQTYMSQFSSCTVFTGDLELTDGITDLSPLDGYTTITGKLRIYNTELPTLAGLESLTSVGMLDIDDNDNLTTLEGLDNLESVGTLLSIVTNDELTDISALAGLTSLADADVMIADNLVLTNCAITSICNNLSDLESWSFSGNGAGCGDLTEVEEACQSVLPVTLVGFSVKKENSSSLLSWTTTSEVNSSHFLVQQSASGKVWRDLGTVPSKGAGNYSFIDSQPWDGHNYYRLKMIDLDGSFAYSRIKNVHFDFDMALYPNPVSDRLLIKNTDWTTVRHFQLFNSKGVIVLETRKMQPSGVDISRFSSGAYTARLTYANGSYKTQKIIKD